MICKKCGQEKEPHPSDPHLCAECVNAENTRLTYYRQHQTDWLENAKENDIDLWTQQPGETQWEYTVWTAYRDTYPGKKPSFGTVAEQLCTTRNVVKKIAQRWNFSVRMQAWMAYCDELTLAQRRQEILEMNKDHVDMAALLRTKMKTAIELVDPMALKPGELATLMKMSTELERKARLDTVAQEELQRTEARGTDNPNLKKAPTKQSDLTEIVGILMKAGALGEVSQVGIKQTTEIALVDNEGNAARVIKENE